MTQTEAVLKYIEDFGSITSFEAFEQLGVSRLSGIIFNIRKIVDIKTTNCTTKNRYGHNVNYAKYEKENKEESAYLDKIDKKIIKETCDLIGIADSSSWISDKDDLIGLIEDFQSFYKTLQEEFENYKEYIKDRDEER